ncbi:putative F420-0 ABC transporter substrate-binding protein [Compostimonas suwonensis]|uniref:Iron complex transport system substrate-binding protein n=1 Tax=Compostimonas suwonensis TaxID=1048394 RepID=A0A2M9C018_9MICO|nr:putative F420-0 ABC transporter substrate-binding protein [Compostimonas suwonensis]PJJ63650.1 iron complex transport system substrate-binding protein [Compostimonas suwonensis]
MPFHSKPSPSLRTKLLGAIAAAAAVPLLLAGCASGSAASVSGAPSTDPTAVSAGYPVTIDNCGTELTVEKAPQRIVTIKSTTTELLLALGLGDRIVGSAFLDSPFPDELADAGSTIDVVSDFLPSQEAVLQLDPDFVFGGWESNFTADGVGERGSLASRGIGSYVAPSACKESGYMPDPLTFDDVFDEIDEAGAVFDATDAATALVAEQKTALEAIGPLDAGTSALWYSSGEDSPYVGAGIGAPQMIMDAAGLDNIFADVHDTWTTVGWESVVEADPDVIVLVDASWNTAQSKIDMLESNPATAVLDAVRNKRYVTVPFAAGEAGIRNVDAVEAVVDQVRAMEG